jgi:hypothetical protein
MFPYVLRTPELAVCESQPKRKPEIPTASASAAALYMRAIDVLLGLLAVQAARPECHTHFKRFSP